MRRGYEKLRERVVDGTYAAIIAAPPCSTFSISRFFSAKSASDGGPPPVRTRTEIEGCADVYSTMYPLRIRLQSRYVEIQYILYPLYLDQIQWIRSVSALGPDTVDTYRPCRVFAGLRRSVGFWECVWGGEISPTFRTRHKIAASSAPRTGHGDASRPAVRGPASAASPAIRWITPFWARLVHDAQGASRLRAHAHFRHRRACTICRKGASRIVHLAATKSNRAAVTNVIAQAP